MEQPCQKHGLHGKNSQGSSSRSFMLLRILPSLTIFPNLSEKLENGHYVWFVSPTLAAGDRREKRRMALACQILSEDPNTEAKKLST